MKHITVLLNEAIEYLDIKPNGIYVDGTLGGAGHSELILSKLTGGKLIAFDQDEYAITVANKKLEAYQNKIIIKDNFANIKRRLNEIGIEKIDGVLLDLGMSSFQIDDEKRGFSYLADTNLDMRMNQKQELSAHTIVNTYTKDELAKIFFKYGEEENAFKIANRIIDNRPLNTTKELVDICDKVNYNRKGHSAKKVFQALRIAVNDEMGVLERFLDSIIDLMNDEGRIVIITFHSLEDRIVKHFFKENSEIKVPKNLPLINIPKPKLSLVTKKPIYPSNEEMETNSRSKSAKLRVAKKNDAIN